MIETNLINRDPEIMSGTPVFMGTRVPVKTLFDYIEGDYPLDEFLDHFPTVSREQTVGVLKLCRSMLIGENEEDTTNTLKALEPLMPLVLDRLQTAKPGDVFYVSDKDC